MEKGRQGVRRDQSHPPTPLLSLLGSFCPLGSESPNPAEHGVKLPGAQRG